MNIEQGFHANIIGQPHPLSTDEPRDVCRRECVCYDARHVEGVPNAVAALEAAHQRTGIGFHWNIRRKLLIHVYGVCLLF